ncbi:MAG: glycosyltransferase family 2 protein, partial [Chloroflexota bacterium]
MTTLPIGVIVKTWNTGEHTRACLDRVAHANDLPEELAVVDLGDDAATHRYLEELTERSGIRLHWLSIGRRLAPGEANRRALAALSTPLVCL